MTAQEYRAERAKALAPKKPTFRPCSTATALSMRGKADWLVMAAGFDPAEVTRLIRRHDEDGIEVLFIDYDNLICQVLVLTPAEAAIEAIMKTADAELAGLSDTDRDYVSLVVSAWLGGGDHADS